jgi:RNA polymerase sigma factor (sigma-70 family)
MQNKSDAQLLREYAAQHSEPAFAEIVVRHTDLVYSAACRQTGSPDLAREIAQSVFTDLARKARALAGSSKPDASLAGWLYRGTRFATLTLLRGERRRQAHERQFMEHFNPASETAPDWERVAPVLDEAMAELGDDDREAVLLRYFKNQDFQAVGLALGVSDAAAQRRVSRAVERLREFFAKRGVTVGASGLVVLITANAVQTAPTGLAASVAQVSITGASAATPSLMAKLAEAFLASKGTLLVGGFVTALVIAFMAVNAGNGQAPDKSKNIAPAAMPAMSTNHFHPVALERFYQRLFASYNGSQSWGIVPRGVVEFDGVPFRMFGKIEMNGMGSSRDRGFLPPRVGEIPVNGRATRLHLVSAAGYKDPDGTPVAELRLHYTNGQHRNLFIRYGEHVRNMHAAPDERRTDLSDSRSQMVWNGTTEGNKPEEFRLFKNTFDNPLPTEEIRGIELLSLFGKSYLALCAITLEEATTNAPAPQITNEEPDDTPYRRESLVRVLDEQNGQPISNAVLNLTVTDIDRTYGFGRYRSDALGQILIDYPPGKFSAIQLQLTATGYLPFADVQPSAEGILASTLLIHCAPAPPGTAVVRESPANLSATFVPLTNVLDDIESRTANVPPRKSAPTSTTSLPPAVPKNAVWLMAVLAFGIVWLLASIAALWWGVRTVQKKPALGWTFIAAAATQFVMMALSAVCFPRFAELFTPSQPGIVASFKNDFQENEPKPGWSYLWNPEGVIGQRANYVALQWDGRRYQASVDQPYPARSASHYLRITRGAGHPGGGLREAPRDVEHYVIAAFTVPRSARYSITGSRIARLVGQTCGAVVVRVFVDSREIEAALLCESREGFNFDRSLGKISSGSTIYVAVGPGDTDCDDSFELDFSIAAL